MAATAHLRSLEVLTESTFGSPDSNGEVPAAGSVTGTWRGLECERPSLAAFGEPAVNEDMTVTDGFGGLPLEPNTAWAAGGSVRLKREQGDLTYTAPLRGALGSTAPLRELLASAFHVDSSGGGSVAVQATPGTNAGQFNLLTSLKIGTLIMVEIDGRVEAARVTNVTGAGPYTITVGTYFSRALDTGDTIYLGATFSVCRGANAGTVGDSVALLLSDLQGTTLATGCRQRVTRIYSENGQIKVDGTVQCAFVRNDASSAGTVVNPTRSTGAVQHMRKVRPCYSALAAPGKSASAGFSSTRNALPLNVEWECVIEHTLAEVSDGGQTIVGASDLEVTNTTVTLNMTAATWQTAILNDLRDQNQRMIVLPAGPLVDGASDASGFALVLSAGVLANESGIRDLSGELIQQTLNFTLGRYDGDNGAEAFNNAPVAFFIGEV